MGFQRAIFSLFFMVLFLVYFFAGMADVWGDVGTGFQPRISVKWEYDDNIYFSQTDAISDALTYVSPGFQSEISTDNWNASIDYEMQWVSYFHHSSSNSIRHYLSLKGMGSFADNWSLALYDSYARSEDPAQIQEAISGIKYENLKYDYNEGSIGLTRTFGAESYVSVGYENMLLKSRTREVADTMSHHPYMDVMYWLSYPMGIRLEGRDNIGRFDNSDDFQEPELAVSLIRRLDWDTNVSIRTAVSLMNFDGQTQDYKIYDIGIGVKRVFMGNMGSAAGLGYYYQDNEQGESNIKDLSGYLNFWRQGANYKVSLEFSKGFDEIYFDGEDLGFSKCWVVGAELDYSISPAFFFGFESSYRDDTFPHAQEEVKERTWLFSCHGDWHVASWCALTLSYSRWDRSANSEDYTYLDNRILFSVTFLGF